MPYSTADIRNIALVGQAGAGKTLLAEALLAQAGAIKAKGSLARGTTVCDFDPQEKALLHSLDAAICGFETQGKRVNVIDTPGYPDFLGRSLCALEAVETAVIVVSAVNGVEAMTQRMMDFAKARGLCRLIVVNKIDSREARTEEVLGEIREAFGKACLPLNLPADGGKSVVDCFFQASGRLADFSSVEAAHTQIIDQVVEVDEALKPTYGRVSRYGLVAFASSLDQIGPFTKDVRDSALVLNAISGYDKLDSTSIPEPVPDYTAALDGNIRGLKIGLPKEYFISGLSPEVKSSVDAAVKKLTELGAEVVEISLPHTEYAAATYYIIAPAEASANLARFDGIRYGARVAGADPIDLYSKTRGQGFGPEVKRRIILGTYVLSSGYYDAFYLRAQKVRTLIRQDFIKAFEQVDAIVTPTTPTPAFKVGEKSDDPIQMYLSDVFTISCNLAGICGLSLPCGFSASPKLPIGLQLLGKPFGESTILKIAHAYEQSTGWHLERPSL